MAFSVFVEGRYWSNYGSMGRLDAPNRIYIADFWCQWALFGKNTGNGVGGGGGHQ